MTSFKTKILIGTSFCALAAFMFVVLRRQNPPEHILCQTTKGPLDIIVMKEWSPRGADRFLTMIDDGFFARVPLFRCMDHFLCQFGAIPPDRPKKNYLPINDDPSIEKLREFKAGYLSFAGSGPNTRATHIFIALDAVKSLGTQPWETPFGYVSESSLSTAKSFNTSYGDSSPSGNGPNPQKIEGPDGATYLEQNFPRLDWITFCARKRE